MVTFLRPDCGLFPKAGLGHSRKGRAKTSRGGIWLHQWGASEFRTWAGIFQCWWTEKPMLNAYIKKEREREKARGVLNMANWGWSRGTVTAGVTGGGLPGGPVGTGHQWRDTVTAVSTAALRIAGASRSVGGRWFPPSPAVCCGCGPKKIPGAPSPVERWAGGCWRSAVAPWTWGAQRWWWASFWPPSFSCATPPSSSTMHPHSWRTPASCPH